jgi:hypothetical protein
MIAIAAASLVIDADTLRHPDGGSNVRLTGAGDVPYDAPETHRPECDEEVRLGALATMVVERLVSAPDVAACLYVYPDKGGGFGRRLGTLYVGGHDLGNVLAALNLARPAMNYDWCAAP